MAENNRSRCLLLADHCKIPYSSDYNSSIVAGASPHPWQGSSRYSNNFPYHPFRRPTSPQHQHLPPWLVPLHHCCAVNKALSATPTAALPKTRHASALHFHPPAVDQHSRAILHSSNMYHGSRLLLSTKTRCWTAPARARTSNSPTCITAMNGPRCCSNLEEPRRRVLRNCSSPLH